MSGEGSPAKREIGQSGQSKVSWRSVRLAHAQLIRMLVAQKQEIVKQDRVIASQREASARETAIFKESFSTSIGPSPSREELHSNTLTWVLENLGYCNAAIFWAADEKFHLVGYMDHDTPAKENFIQDISEALCPTILREGVMHDSSGTMPLLKNQDILGISCDYKGETLAVIVAFRDKGYPFSEIDKTALMSIRAPLATALAKIIIDVQGQSVQEDWWKRGESPPSGL